MHSMGAASNLSRMYCCRAGFSSIETWSPHRSTCDVDSTNCVKTLIKVVLAGSSPLDSGICDDPLALAKASTALSVIVSDAALSNSCSAMPQMAVLAPPRASKKGDTAACSRVVNGCKGSVWQQSPKSFAGCPLCLNKTGDIQQLPAETYAWRLQEWERALALTQENPYVRTAARAVWASGAVILAFLIG